MIAALLARRRDALPALLALVAWLAGALALPALHAWDEAHHDERAHLTGFDAACPADCDDADHHHGHDHATCPACRVLQLDAAPSARGPRVERIAVAPCLRALPAATARDASVAPSRPRGPPAPSFLA